MFLYLSVSRSVHRGGVFASGPRGCLPLVQGDVHPLGTHPQATPPPAQWDTVNKRGVRILLECILV